MKQRARRITVGAALASVVVVVLLWPHLKGLIEEEQLLRALSSDEQREHAAKELARRGSLRAIQKLLRLSAPQWIGLNTNSSEWAEEAIEEIEDKNLTGASRAIVACLDDVDPIVRCEAARRLYGHGPWLVEALPVLLRTLRDEDVAVRVQSAACLWRLGVEAQTLVSPLVGALDQTRVRNTAIELLTALANEDTSAASALADCARRELLQSQYCGAWKSLSVMGEPGAIALKPLLTDASAEVREEALRTIELLGCAASYISQSVVQATHDTEPAVRTAAIFALAAMAEEVQNAVPTLVSILRQSSEETDQRAAAEALGQCGAAATMAARDLIGTLDLMTPQVGAEAVRSLGRICPELTIALPALVRAIESSNDEIRAAAAESLFRLGTDALPALSYLEAAIDDTSLGVYVWVAATLVAVGEDRSGLFLNRLINAVTHDEVQIAACTILGLLGPIARGARPKLLQRALAIQNTMSYRGRTQSVEAFAFPVEALRSIGVTAEDLRPAMEALRSDNADLRRRAFSILVSLGDTCAVALSDLEEALSSDDPEVAAYAAQILAGLGPKAENAVPALARLLAAQQREIRLQSWNALRLILGTRKVYEEMPTAGRN